MLGTNKKFEAFGVKPSQTTVRGLCKRMKGSTRQQNPPDGGEHQPAAELRRSHRTKPP